MADVSRPGLSHNLSKHRLELLSIVLPLIKELKPINFRWKSDNLLDPGIDAQEVEKVKPLLVTHTFRVRIEGVKYDLVTVTFVNGVNRYSPNY